MLQPTVAFSAVQDGTSNISGLLPNLKELSQASKKYLSSTVSILDYSASGNNWIQNIYLAPVWTKYSI